MLTLVLAASEPSKVPFYIAGLVLVAWAVAIGTVGVRNADNFPGSAQVMRGVVAVTVLLVVITLAMAIHTSAFPHG